ncbi:MAG: BON domain-containing protein [Candidatus Sericytochromatia bacterium]
MNFFDWLSLSIMLTTLIGAEVTPQTHNAEMVRTTEAQVASNRAGAVAGIAIGGRLVFQLADSGLSMAEERAIDARESLNRAIFHYDIPNKYNQMGLRLSGKNDFVEVYYYDLRLLTATAADARAADAETAWKLAESWKVELHRAFRELPKAVPDGWVATTGSVAGATMISDSMLASTAADVLRYSPGQQVRLSAKAGVIIAEGTVSTDAQRRKVVRTLKRLPGVRGVEDKLVVQAPTAAPRR